jgi:hypothetical protein
MRNLRRTARGSDSDHYRAFMNLDREHRRNLALRVLSNQGLLADLCHHFFIQRALEEHGRSIPWATYKRVSSKCVSPTDEAARFHSGVCKCRETFLAP